MENRDSDQFIDVGGVAFVTEGVRCDANDQSSTQQLLNLFRNAQTSVRIMAVQSWLFLLATMLVTLISLQLLGSDIFTRSDRIVRKMVQPGSHGDGHSLPHPFKTPHCDIFAGRWVRDNAYPLYQPGSCPYVEESFRCLENGRPDSDYTRWSWKPNDCEIPRFNATDMLHRLRGKRLVFVGDSLSRNQWESMLCLLTEALADKSRVFEVHGERITREKGAFVFKFVDYDCKVEFYSSHFLMTEESSFVGNAGKCRLTLRLDMVDASHSKWRDAAVLVFTTGHWWTHGKTAKGRSFYKEGGTIHRKLNLMVAFSKAMKTWADWVDKFVNPEKTLVFVSGYSPAHFMGGQWNSGGECQTEIEPIFNESHLPSNPEKMPILEASIHRMKFPAKLLNVTKLSSFRKDAHPSVYGLHGSQKGDAIRGNGYQDCSHWCLPGVPDVWNELLYALMVRNDAG